MLWEKKFGNESHYVKEIFKSVKSHSKIYEHVTVKYNVLLIWIMLKFCLLEKSQKIIFRYLQFLHLAHFSERHQSEDTESSFNPIIAENEILSFPISVCPILLEYFIEKVKLESTVKIKSIIILSKNSKTI